MGNRLTKFDYKMFKRAAEVAKKSDFSGGTKVGCVLAYKGHVISEACNTDKTSPEMKYYNRYRHFRNNQHGYVRHSNHAEVSAIHKVTYPIAQQIDWKDVSLYTFRWAPGLPKKFGMSRPCPSCIQAIRDKGIRDIFYCSNDGFVYERLNDA